VLCASCGTGWWRDGRYLIEAAEGGGGPVPAISLMHHEGPGIEVNMWAEARPDGTIVVAGQDIGPRVEKIWGDMDYEYWLTVHADDRGRLAAVLRDATGEDAASEAGDTDPGRVVLLLLRSACLEGRFRGTSDLARWLAERGIATEFASYA